MFTATPYSVIVSCRECDFVLWFVSGSGFVSEDKSCVCMVTSIHAPMHTSVHMACTHLYTHAQNYYVHVICVRIEDAYIQIMK